MNQKILAEKLNLSQSTVSLAIKGSLKIPEKTRKLVLAAAAEQGYRPSTAGQLLRGKRSNVIGVVLPDLRNEFFAELFQSLQQHFLQHGYLACLVQAETPDELNNAAKYLHELHAAGVVASGIHPEPFFTLKKKNTAVVFYGGNAPIPGPFSQILPDRFTAGKELTEYLLGKGHRRIAFLGVTSREEQRYLGYRAALQAAGADFELALSDPVDGSTMEGGYRMMKQLLAEQHNVDAVFAHNDATAIGAMHAAVEMGIVIPRDIAITGFDNIQVGAYLNPPLTTVEQSQKEIVAAIVAEVLSAIGNPEHRTHISIPCRLIVRNSA